METFQAIVVESLSQALVAAGLPTAGEVTPATDPRFGDYQTNAAMVLAKQRGENPRSVAAQIIDNFDVERDGVRRQPWPAPASSISRFGPTAVAQKTVETSAGRAARRFSDRIERNGS